MALVECLAGVFAHYPVWNSTTLWLIAVNLLALGYLFAKQRKDRMSVLKRHGIPGPEPHWLFGNLKEYLQTPNVLWDGQLIAKYGPICGYYLGAKPVILVSDLPLINLIQGKLGNSFLHRPRRVPGGINPDPKRAKMLGNLQVPEWKLLRGILDKVFSPSRLDGMARDVKRLSQIFVSQVTSPRQEVVDFYKLSQNLTLDQIGKTGFGVDSNIQENPNETLKAAVEQEFSKSTGTFLLQLYLCLPEFQWLLHSFRVSWENLKSWLGWGQGLSELWRLGEETVQTRKRGRGQQTPDLLQVMLDSRKLSEDWIVPNSVLFFEAGFETLSASLAFTIHLLMGNLEVQDNVRNEIREVVVAMEEGEVCLDKMKELRLLDAVINEALRMYPPQTTFIGRSGSEDLPHMYNLAGATKVCVIPKDVHVQICLFQILNSEETWPSPRTFCPQRFLGSDDEDGVDQSGLTKLQQTAFQPFGRGKRICIGRKYADMVLKIALVQLLSKYRLLPAGEAQTETEIEVIFK